MCVLCVSEIMSLGKGVCVVLYVCTYIRTCVRDHAAFGSLFSCNTYIHVLHSIHTYTCILPVLVCACIYVRMYIPYVRTYVILYATSPDPWSAAAVQHSQELLLWCDGVLSGAAGPDGTQHAAQSQQHLG